MSDPNANRPGYKETKIGWIPEDWECVHLEEVATIQTGLAKGKAPKGKAIKMPYLRVANVQDGHVDLAELKQITVGSDEIERYRLRADDVLFTEGGDFDKLGRGCVWNGEIDPCLHQNHVFSVRCGKKLMPLLLAAFASSPIGRRYFELNSKQSTNLASINSSQLRAFPIPIAGNLEQKKIAEILSTCDEAIEKTGALIAAKKRQKRALMQQLLTGKKRLPGFEGEWKNKRMSDLLKTVERPVDWDDDAHYNLVSVRRRSGGLFMRETLQGNAILTKTMATTHVGDFVISKMQVVHGAMAMTPLDLHGAHVSGSYITLIPKDDNSLHMPFFDYMSQTKWLYHLAFISSYGVVIEKMTFNLRDFLKKRISIPSAIEEQRAICGILDCSQESIALLERKKAALQKQKKALMQKLLTGQVRVKV